MFGIAWGILQHAPEFRRIFKGPADGLALPESGKG
jgi:hypothetical protein